MTTPQIPNRFTAEDSTLLLIDHQVGTMQLIKNIDRELAARQSIGLAEMVKILDMPVVITSSQEDHAQGRFSRKSPGSFPKRMPHGSSVPAWSVHGRMPTSEMRCGQRGART